MNSVDKVLAARAPVRRKQEDGQRCHESMVRNEYLLRADARYSNHISSTHYPADSMVVIQTNRVKQVVHNNAFPRWPLKQAFAHR